MIGPAIFQCAEVVMLDHYFTKPSTLDRVRASWFAPAIEKYVERLAGEGYSRSSITRRVALLCRFAEFAEARGARTVVAAEPLLEGFVNAWQRSHAQRRPTPPNTDFAKNTRTPVQQAIHLALSGAIVRQRSRSPLPFSDAAPGFFAYLREERGLKEATIGHYRHYLNRLASYLHRKGVESLGALSPALLARFVVDNAPQLSRSARRDLCGCTRVLLSYCYRERIIGRDLSNAVEMPQSYRLASLPRAISWDEVRQLLQVIDRRTLRGRRDYAMLLLLIVYGLRGCEVAALTLDDLDWKREQLRIRQRKAGHSTGYPLAGVVAEAIIEYLTSGRPRTTDRHVFFRTCAPRRPITSAALSASVAEYLRRAGVHVHRAGSHTLRHTCVQRLVDAQLPLKSVGDYVGHRSPDSTAIYAKVALSTLREIAMGDGEAL
jgi:integrase/recombinase XerD